MSLWEFGVAAEGWIKANRSELSEPASMTEEEHDALMSKYG